MAKTATVAPVVTLAAKDVERTLAAIAKASGGADVTDSGVASKIAKKLNKAGDIDCPTGNGRMHPARPGFVYWTGLDVVAYAAKHS